MKSFIWLMLGAVCVAALAGCEKSPKDKAADKIAQQADVARRYYLQAAALMSYRPVVRDANSSLSALPGQVESANRQRFVVLPYNEAALPLLDKAAGVASKALAENSQATMIGKIPANRVLAEINRQRAAYFNQLARVHETAARQRWQQVELKAFELDELARQADFYSRLALVDPSKIQEMLQQAQQEQARDQAARQQLLAGQKALEDKIVQAVRDLEPLEPQAHQLRQQAANTQGLAALDILRQAEQIERQADAQETQLNDLKLQLEQLSEHDRLSAIQVEGATNRITTMEACLKDVAHCAQIVGDSQRQLALITDDVAGGVASVEREVVVAFSAALDNYEQALSAYDKARQANNAWSSGLSTLASDASRLEGPSRGAGAQQPSLLSMMGAPVNRLSAVAFGGELEVAAGDTLRRHAGSGWAGPGRADAAFERGRGRQSDRERRAWSGCRQSRRLAHQVRAGQDGLSEGDGAV